MTQNVGRPASVRLAIATLLTIALAIGEVVAAGYTGSLALLADAGHNVSDVLVLALSWAAAGMARRPATPARTFGFHRAGILSALLNAILLGGTGVAVAWEAARRLAAPPPLRSDLLIAAAGVAFLVNAGSAALVSEGRRGDLNVRSAFLHLAGDAVTSLGALLAGVLIRLTGLRQIDPLISLALAGWLVWCARGLVLETVEILMEAAPRGMDMDRLVADLRSIEGVRGVHDLHVWSLNARLPALAVHLVVDDMSIEAGARLQARVNEMLVRRYAIAHATLQLECEDCEPDLLYCDLEELQVSGALRQRQETRRTEKWGAGRKAHDASGGGGKP